jgi:2-succinyl-6-hydroxy-2,4-cyclohexadiene-1-carboxylate synthase
MARVVLLHGFTQTGRSWRHVPLGDQHELLAVDLPGHGTAPPDPRSVLQVGAALRARYGADAVYVGYSLGARFALGAAIAGPIAGLVLISATAGIDHDDDRAARRAADRALADEIERIGAPAFVERWLAQPMFAGVPLERADADERAANTAAGLASSLRHHGQAEMPPRWDDLTRITAPALVLAGELDTRYVFLARKLAAALPEAALHVEPGAGHAVHLERPDAVGAAIERLIARAATPR